MANAPNPIATAPTPLATAIPTASTEGIIANTIRPRPTPKKISFIMKAKSISALIDNICEDIIIASDNAVNIKGTTINIFLAPISLSIKTIPTARNGITKDIIAKRTAIPNAVRN